MTTNTTTNSDHTIQTHQLTNHNTTPTRAPTTQMKSPLPLPSNLTFGPFKVHSQTFHLSPTHLSFGLVNLKPLLPGHVLICPVRRVPRLSQLSARETADLFLTVRRVSRTLERVFGAESMNVAVQDGVEAGQSVPHVHVHVIPRVRKDMEARGGSDAVYDIMDGEEGNLGELFLRMYRRRKEREAQEREIGGPDVDDKREPRSEEVMKAEAEWLRNEMEKEGEMEDDYAIDSNV